MIYMTLAEAAYALNCRYDGMEVGFEGVSIDTRSLEPGNLFFAIKGPNHDGHDFINQAAEKGAQAVVVSRRVRNCPIPTLLVRDTEYALGTLATAWRDRFDIDLIGVTGSNGKTTTRRMIDSILKAAVGEGNEYQVLSTLENLNNHLGVPLTLCRLARHHKYAVVEMGMNGPGEIAYLSRLAEPDVALITNVSPVHVEGVGSVEGIANAKAEIFEGMHHNGVGIIDADCRYARKWRQIVRPRRCMTFGFHDRATVHGKVVDAADNIVKIFTRAGDVEVKLPLAGKHNAHNAIAAAAVAQSIELPLEAIKTGLENVAGEKRRLETIYDKDNLVLIDDAYNASPASSKAAAEVLASHSGRKVYVFADMLELGKKAADYHKDLGKQLQEFVIDALYAYGDLAQKTVESFGELGQHYTEQEAMIEALKGELKADTTIMFKASNGMQMKAVINALLQELF